MQFSTLSMFTHCMCTQHPTRSLLRLTLFNFMEDQFVTTYMQSKQKTKNIANTFIPVQQPTYFLPVRCAYLSHLQFSSSSTRVPPGSRDS